MKKILSLTVFVVYNMNVNAQGFAINTDGSAPDNSAILHIKSNTHGILIVQMTEAERNAILLPAHGLLIYQTNNIPGYYYNSGTSAVPAWIKLTTDNNSWHLTGNSGTNASVNFIGTTTNQPLRFRTNNIFSGELSSIKTFFGFNSGNITGTGLGNTAIGVYSFTDHTTGEYNTSTGYNSLSRNTTGSYNTAVGASAAFSTTTGSNNTAAGFESLSTNTTGNSNSAFGYRALISNNGSYNTATGSGSLFYNTTGIDNSALGYRSLFNNTTGSGNTSHGSLSLYNSTTGNDNTAVGHNSLSANTTASANTAIGHRSLFANTTGPSNTAVGNTSLEDNTTGSQNTTLGAASLRNNTTGNNNTAAGNLAGSNNLTGSQNSFFGFRSNNLANTNINNSTAIGAYSTVSVNDAVILGAVFGINGAGFTASTGIGTNAPQARLHVVNGGTSATLINSNTSAVFDNGGDNYIQASSGISYESGIISATSASSFRSGMIFTSDGSIQLRTGGNITQATLLQNGKMGIGTVAPTATLHINGAIATTPQTFILNAGGNQTINAGDRSFIKIFNYASATATITLADGVADGQMLTIIIRNTSTGFIQFLDNAIVNNTELSTLFLMNDNDSLTLIWDNFYNAWVEVHRSDN